MPRSVKAEIEKRCKEYRDQMASSIERLVGERDQFHRERDRLRALLREVVTQVRLVEHMELEARIDAALEGRDA